MLDTNTFNPKYKEVKYIYEGLCPECGEKLFFSEGSYYCPDCGFSEHDYSRVQDDDD